MKIHALWCHPRSVSTAFERIMRERGDLAVLHEPFMYHHYLTTTDRLFPDFEPEPGHPTTYDSIRAMIRDTAQTGPVFFKDMAYYVDEALPQDAEFAGQMTHAFLLRDPVEAALSYARRDPEFTRTELGHEAQHRLYHALVALGQTPLVLTADQLRHDPEATLRRYWAHVRLPYIADAFEWDDRVPKDWKSVEGWHSEVLQSGAIQKPEQTDTAAQLAALGAPYTDYAAHHTPFYAEMQDIAETQAHQK
ncbi:sulfotransferase family protein [Roseovarius sp. 2305UL8-3]|uniref:sulfotransferase-like domain-containing protein n=1 Tax=Roseovarius conchicola TaxID=3121636 RepID=UPI0035298AE3